MLPLLIGDYVTENEAHWDNFLLMLTITDYVFAPLVSEDTIAHLKILIQEHHDAFCTLYPSAPIIPKHHYVVHLPDFMLK